MSRVRVDTVASLDGEHEFDVAIIPQLLIDVATSIKRDNPTGSALLPVGNTAQRGAIAPGKLRFNTDLQKFEGCTGTAWGAVGGGAKGGEGNDIFYENDTTVTLSYTITAGKNAMSAGPITIAAGVIVTIPTGSTWSIV